MIEGRGDLLWGDLVNGDDLSVDVVRDAALVGFELAGANADFINVRENVVLEKCLVRYGRFAVGTEDVPKNFFSQCPGNIICPHIQ